MGNWVCGAHVHVGDFAICFFVIILEGLGAVATGLGNWKK